MHSRFFRQPAAVALLSTLAPLAFVSLRAMADNNSTESTLPEVNITGQTDQKDYSPYVSTVGGKVPTTIRDIPQTVTVVNRAVLESQGVASLADALHNVPGITLGGAEGGQIGNNINLRGFSARTDMYLDGMRDRGQYYRDTFDLESVEVLKGPSSMLFGRGSTGGVINQVTRQPELKNHGEVTATVGTNGYERTTMDLNQRLSDSSAFRLDAMAQDVGTTRDVMKNKDFAIAPSLKVGIGTPTQVTLSALVQHNHDMPDYGINAVNSQPANVRKDNFYGLTDDRTIQDVTSLNSKIEHTFNDHLKIRNQTQFDHYTTDARESAVSKIGTLSGSTFTPITTTGNTTSTPLNQLYAQLVSHDRVIHDESLDNQTDLIAKFNTGFIKHELLTGLEVGHDTYNNQAYSRTGLPVLSLLNPIYQATPAGTATTTGNLAQSTANTFAIYGNDTLQLNKQWKAVAGVRWDRYAASITNSINKSNTSSSTAVASADQTVKFTSVRSGLIYQPTDTQSYYVSYGTSFNPSLEQLTLTTGLQDVGPEKNRSYETGGKWDFLNGNLSLNSAIFRIEKTNARSVQDDGTYNLDGDVRVDGIEIGISGHITPKWQLIGGYTYLNAKVVKASTTDGTQGNTLANTPKHTATLWSTYNITPNWEVGGGATYMSNRYAKNDDVVSIGSYRRYDGTIAYHQPKYDIQLNLLNLTDRRDYISVIQSDGGRAVPEIGRTALVTVAYKF